MTEKTTRRRSLADELEAIAPLDMAAAGAAVDAVTLLNKALRTRGFRQSELAERSGVSEGRVSQVINGDGNMRVSTLARFLRALGYRLRITATPAESDAPRLVTRPRDPSRRRELYISSKEVVCLTDDGVRTEQVLEISKMHPRTFAAERREWVKNVATGEIEPAPRDDHPPAEAPVTPTRGSRADVR